MALPLTAGLRVAMRIAKFAGKKLTKKGKQGYKLSRSLVKSKRARTIFAKSTVKKTGTALNYSYRTGSDIAKGTQRHLKFIKNIITPHLKHPLGLNKQQGKSFHHLITRPTFGSAKTRSIATDRALHKAKKPRKILAKAGIYGAYGYGINKIKS